MNLLACFSKEEKAPAVRNCSEFASHKFSTFEECIGAYESTVFDNYMLFFAQIAPICSFYNSSTPSLSTAAIFNVTFH